MNHTTGQGVSISIVTYAIDRELLTEAIRSLSTAVSCAKDFAPWELLIIDNGNNDSILDEIVTEFTDLPFTVSRTKNVENRGFGRAHNQAISNTNSRYHIILNPDVIFDEQALVTALEYLTGHPEAVAVAPKGLLPNGTPAYLCKSYPSVADLTIRGFLPESMQHLFESRLQTYECRTLSNSHPEEIKLLSGCCIVARSDALKSISGFHEQYFLYFEDFDLSLRLQELGVLVHLPTMLITHHGGNTAKKGLLHVRYFVVSAFRFFNRWGWKLF